MDEAEGPPIRAIVAPVTPLQQNCTIVWCVKTLKAAVIAAALAALGDPVDPEGVLAVRPLDRRAGGVLQRRHAAGVIHVAVGDPDLLQRGPTSRHCEA